MPKVYSALSLYEVNEMLCPKRHDVNLTGHLVPVTVRFSTFERKDVTIHRREWAQHGIPHDRHTAERSER